MRVLLVYTVSTTRPPRERPVGAWYEISFAVSYLAAALRAAGHEPELVVLRHGRFEAELRGALERCDPGLVCHTAVATEYPLVCQAAERIRAWRPWLFQAIGGSHASLRPEEVIEGPFDALCVGEGEEAVVELADALARGEPPASIRNLWIERDGEVERNPTRPFTPDLDRLPFADREIWRPWVEDTVQHTLLIARGCPYPCTYCSNHALLKLAEGRYVRFRSVESVIAELTRLRVEFPDAEDCYFEVETITADLPWAFRFAEALERFNAGLARPMRFALNFRVVPRRDFTALFEAFRRAGFWFLRIGVESGSERVRRTVLRRNETNADLRSVFDQAHRAGLQVFTYNLVGLPGERPEDFLETVEINRHPGVTRSYLSIFHPYPGTALERVCAERGIEIPPMTDGAERFRARLGLPEFPDREVERCFRAFPALVAGRRASLLERADRYFWQTIRGYPRLARVAGRLSGHGVLRRARRAARALSGIRADVADAPRRKA